MNQSNMPPIGGGKGTLTSGVGALHQLRDAALAYASYGWPVFPCIPRRKEPAGEVVPNGCLDATTDADLIREWWARRPMYNIGIATGAPGPDVVDFDVDKGKPGQASFNTLTRAGLLAGGFALITTPSGGWHLYYAGTEQGNGSLRAAGVDFRAKGGYVLAPPSVVDGVAYRRASYREPTGATVNQEAIRALLAPRPAGTTSHVARSPENGDDFRQLYRDMAAHPEGNRNNYLFWAACRIQEKGGGTDDLVKLRDAALQSGLDLVAANKTVKSAIAKRGAVA